MTAEKRNDIILWLIIMAAAIGVWANSGTLIPNGDDFAFAFKIVADKDNVDGVVREPLTGFGDIVEGQKVLYRESNGRVLIVSLVQLLGGMWPRGVFRVVNALVFALTAFVICRLTVPKNPLTAVVTVCSLLFLFPEAGSLYNSPVFSINYLWALLLTLCAIVVWKRDLWQLSPLMIIAGWSHEAFSLSVAGAMFFSLIYRYRRLGKFGPIRNRCVIFLFYAIGVVFLVLSPGNFIRLSDGESAGVLSMLVHRCFNMLSDGWIWAMILVAVCSLVADRKGFVEFCRNQGFLVMVIVLTTLFLFALGSFQGRVGYSLSAFCLLFLLRYFRSLLSRFDKPAVYLTLGVCVLGLQWGVIAVNAKQKAAYDEIVRDYLQSPDGTVAVDRRPTVPGWAKLWANPYEAVITPDIPLDANTRSYSADFYRHPLHSPLLTFSPEELRLLRNPELLFVEANRFPGDAGFYTTPEIEHFVRMADTTDTAGYLTGAREFTAIYATGDTESLHWRKRLKKLVSPLPSSGPLLTKPIIVNGQRYIIASKNSPYPLTAIDE